ncbi:MAG: NAD(+) synthase [Planctomycetales bacterium]|nr:NAD(+) synthase [Planctomycetales bacterium]
MRTSGPSPRPGPPGRSPRRRGGSGHPDGDGGGGSADWTVHGFHRIAAIAPRVHVADPERNADEILAWARRAAEKDASVALFPELSVTGYTCEDLFQSEALLAGARRALGRLAEESAPLPLALVVGAPWRTPDGRLYDVAFVLHRGKVRGAVPKSHLPNYGEFYERRWFVPGGHLDARVADDVLGEFRLSPRQLFEMGRLVLGIEVCEDLWAPVPPSSAHALAGANLLLNLSASNQGVAKSEYRRDLVRQQSARLLAGYAYVSCGPSESTKDIVFGGDALVAENGVLLAEGPRFEAAGWMTFSDVDVERLLHERARNMTFGTSPVPREGYTVERLGAPPRLADLGRSFAKTPFVPDDPATVDERAREILSIQSAGLATRLASAGAATAVVGVSGGLDSTLALLVAVEAAKRLGRPASTVLAVSMPGFGTTERTRGSAGALAGKLGATFREIPIREAVEKHFRDIGHDPKRQDLVYENAQARERTQVLFDLANGEKGIVVGTGDLSELALGWCTYNADHMAGYAVNVSVPKTLVHHLVSWYARHLADAGVREVLERVLATPISPELLPPTAEGIQSTEGAIGPFVLHDFFLFHHLRNGSGPRKVLALAERAFAGDYSREEVRKWLRVFLERFYRNQFKRTCLPPGPKVGTVSLSPRGDLRMPDEADPAALLRELDER